MHDGVWHHGCAVGAAPGWGSDISAFLEKEIFFIAGMPRSGTSRLQTILDAHPDIACHGEGHFFDIFLPAVRPVVADQDRKIAAINERLLGASRSPARFDEGAAAALTAAAFAVWMMRQPGVRTAPIVGEKTPDNLAHLDLLARLFPRARFVLALRDGRDNAVSAWFHNLRLSRELTLERYGSFPSYVRRFAWTWRTGTVAALDFAQRHPGRSFLVRYKELHFRETYALTRILAFLGADTSDDVVGQCLAEASFERMSGGRPRGEEDPGAFLRKGVPGDWRNHLSEADNAAFLGIAGDMMERAGYL